ncbi:MAG: bifunctional riboflavin kinase/FAD synthetase [Ignavibacteriae bacterium]|nr:bifunctional riboflavin kinase/FAD synthetase [Ignavibacteriota bacterium]
MRVVNSLREAGATPSVLTLGTFDGVHRGHAAIIDTVRAEARRTGLRSVLLTFDPHPREVLRPDNAPVHLLTTIDERLRIFAGHGLDLCIVLPFTRDLSMLEADEFFRDIIVGALGAREVVVGVDHAFGRGRGGRLDALRAMGVASGVGVTVVPELVEDGVKVSSTSVRTALLDGDAARAAALLGRPYSFEGIVRRGDGLGRTLGFPTANIHSDTGRKLIPKPGVYAVTVVVDGVERGGMLNIGRRPTVSDQEHLSVEVHIFDFHGDLYGMSAEVRLVARLRDEARFASAVELVAQLHEDERTARALVRSMTHLTTETIEHR